MQSFAAVHWMKKELQTKLKCKKEAYPSKQLQNNTVEEILATVGKIHPPIAASAQIHHEITVLVMIFPFG